MVFGMASAERYRDGRPARALRACSQDLLGAEAEDECSILSQMYSGGVILNRLSSGRGTRGVPSQTMFRSLFVYLFWVFRCCLLNPRDFLVEPTYGTQFAFSSVFFNMTLEVDMKKFECMCLFVIFSNFLNIE